MTQSDLMQQAWKILKDSGALSDSFRGFWDMKKSHIKEFIEVHNQLFPDKKEKASCPPCIMRAISRFKAHFPQP